MSDTVNLDKDVALDLINAANRWADHLADQGDTDDLPALEAAIDSAHKAVHGR